MLLDRLIIGISGASGVQYGVRALELLQALPIETHLIMSKSAELTVHHELDCSVDEIKALADVYHSVRNVGASVASGSFQTRGMLLAPCSIRTLGEITTGVTSSLLTRAADVILKERRRLVLMVQRNPAAPRAPSQYGCRDGNGGCGCAAGARILRKTGFSRRHGDTKCGASIGPF